MNLKSLAKDDPKQYGYERMFPEETCPQCGRKFTRWCRRSEWGYWFNDSEAQHTGNLVLLCSGECAKAYGQKRFVSDVKRLMKTKSYKAFRLMEEGATRARAAEAVGMNPENVTTAVNNMRTYHWKELEWLEQHGWEVTE